MMLCQVLHEEGGQIFSSVSPAYYGKWGVGGVNASEGVSVRNPANLPCLPVPPTHEAGKAGRQAGRHSYVFTHAPMPCMYLYACMHEGAKSGGGQPADVGGSKGEMEQRSHTEGGFESFYIYDPTLHVLAPLPAPIPDRTHPQRQASHQAPRSARQPFAMAAGTVCMSRSLPWRAPSARSARSRQSVGSRQDCAAC